MEKGLVSISFRPSSAEEILIATKEAGLSCIEWGSDVHAPYDDPQKLEQVVALQEKYGILCCSYGTYFRLAFDDLEDLPGYIAAAKKLGTNILRLWCGKKASTECTQEEKDLLFSQCAKAAKIAEEAGVTLCLECHRKTYTETKEGALELMQAINSPAFRMYWQPNQGRTVEENLEYASLLKPYVDHVHVFQWKGKERFPLSDGIQEWQAYIEVLGKDRKFLLEFMPDDQITTLPAEAAALTEILGE